MTTLQYNHLFNYFLTAQLKFMEQKHLLLIHLSVKTEHNLVVTGYFNSFVLQFHVTKKYIFC